jgi:flagellar motor component MotA
LGAGRVRCHHRPDHRLFRGGQQHHRHQGDRRAIPGVLKGSKFNKAFYIDALAMLFEVLAKVRKEGLMSIEGDIENPEASPIFPSIRIW